MARPKYKFVVYLDHENKRRAYLAESKETDAELVRILEPKCILMQFPAKFESEEHEKLLATLIEQHIIMVTNAPGPIDLFEEVAGLAVDAAEKYFGRKE